METPNTDNHTGEETAQWLKNNIVGQEITNITNTEITLKNGYILTIECNEGCGACNNGWAKWVLKSSNTKGVVMDVGYKDNDPDGDTFSVFIYCEDTTITIEGDNAYAEACYGYGFYLTLTSITQ